MSEKRWSELEVVSLIAEHAIGTRRKRELLRKGIGDDCAVISPVAHHDMLVTSDMLVDMVHFDSAHHPPELLGRKCMAVNLSDIAAMGGTPRFALVSIALPETVEIKWLNAWVQGGLSMLDEFNCQLIGGDTVHGATLTINVTMLGDIGEGRALYRAGAVVGENIYVTGRLGSSAAGLMLCMQEKQHGMITREIHEPFIARHLDPYPDVAIGRLLAQSGMISAMQDISDGLATDAAHLCTQSNLGAEINADALPAHEDLARVCTTLEVDPLHLQLSGGEDYHLVFTVRTGRDKELLRYLAKKGGYDIFHIGRTVQQHGVRLLKRDGSAVDISYTGYQHG